MKPGNDVAGGAGSNSPATPPDAKERQRAEKFYAKKSGKITCNFTEADVEREGRELEASLKREGLEAEVRPVVGIPDDIMDKLGAVAGDDEKTTRAAQRGHKQAAYIVRAARGRRAELQELLLKGVLPQLLRFAFEENESAAKNWAGMMLASIGWSINKYDKTLCKTNAAYLSEKKKILGEKQLVRVLKPGPIMETVQRELRKAESYRSSLPYLLEGLGRTWIESKLADYLPFMELPDFSKESKPKWWKLLWPLIKKNNPDFLEKSRSGKFPTRGIRYQARWASYRSEFRNALQTVARLRSGGVR